MAKGESKTITRHVTFFKRIPSDSDTETLTPSTDPAQKKELATDVATTPATNVSPPAGRWFPSAETEVIPAEEDTEEIEPEQRQEARPVRARRPPRRFIEEDFE